MTKLEIVKQLEGLRTETALTAVIDAAHGGKRYTAFDVIRIVQAAVSDAVCGMGADESTVTAYEVEREIISKLVQEGCK